jgi:hypothetical protein
MAEGELGVNTLRTLLSLVREDLAETVTAFGHAEDLVYRRRGSFLEEIRDLDHWMIGVSDIGLECWTMGCF